MFSEEISEVVYLGIGLILLSLVITWGLSLLSVKSSYVAVLNEEEFAKEKLRVYREFNAYNNKEITGDGVIVLLTGYPNGTPEIYIDEESGIKDIHVTPLFLTDTAAVNYVSWTQERSFFDLDALRARYNSRRVYLAYLVYDYADVSSVTTMPTPSKDGGVLTGIYLKYKRML